MPIGRGEPINSPTRTTLSEPASSADNPTRKKRAKPASFQHRIVEFLVNQAVATNGEPAQSFGGNQAKVIFTTAQLNALPEPPLPPGYQRFGFDTISAFPFEVTSEMADGSTNLVAASAATRAKIPDSIQALDNRQTAIRGFLLPLKTNNGLTYEFLLMRNQNMCCFGSVPKVNEWISIQTRDEGVKPIMDQPITVMGKLHVGEIRENGYLVGIYRIEADRVVMPE
jgi:hypothetical protein